MGLQHTGNEKQRSQQLHDDTDDDDDDDDNDDDVPWVELTPNLLS